MLKKKALIATTLALVALALCTPFAQASVYSGYDRVGYWILWTRVQKWELWVKIDTTADTWNIVWQKSGG